MKIRKYYILIFLIAFCQFANTLNHDFAWDDKIVLTNNERVQEGISGIPALFIQYNGELQQDRYGYRPVTLTTLAVEYSLFNDNPKGYHFMNVIYFSLLCLVLFKVLRLLFNKYSILLPLLITLLFAVHPLHVESVANIKGRDDILSLLFALLSLYHFLKFYLTPHWRHIIYVVLFFFLGYLSKEGAVTFLMILPLSALFLKRPNFKKFLSTTSLIFVLALVSGVIAYLSLTSTAGVAETEGLGAFKESNELGNSLALSDFYHRVIAAPQLNLYYFKNFLLPYPLTYYPGYFTVTKDFSSFLTILGILFSLALLVFSILRFRKNPLIAFGVLFYLITISVYSQIFITTADEIADRYMFIPSLGLCIALIGVFGWLFKIDFAKKTQEEKISFGSIPRPLKWTFLGVTLLFFILTVRRNTVWENDFTLVSNDMAHLEQSARPHYYYASLLHERLLESPSDDLLRDKMLFHYKKSIELSDAIYYGRMELASYYADQNLLKKSIALFGEMTVLFPNAADPFFYLGLTHYKAENYIAAIPALKKSIKLAPRQQDTYKYLALSYSMNKEHSSAFKYVRLMKKRFPNEQRSYYETVAFLYYSQGDLENATANSLKTIDFGNDPYETYAAIIGRYQNVGDSEKASFYYQRAIQLGIMAPQQ